MHNSLRPIYFNKNTCTYTHILNMHMLHEHYEYAPYTTKLSTNTILLTTLRFTNPIFISG